MNYNLSYYIKLGNNWIIMATYKHKEMARKVGHKTCNKSYETFYSLTFIFPFSAIKLGYLKKKANLSFALIANVLFENDKSKTTLNKIWCLGLVPSCCLERLIHLSQTFPCATFLSCVN